jgi:hypothetical protein
MKSSTKLVKPEFGPHSVKSISDILMGLMHLTKGNYEHVKPLFLKLGAMPDEDEFNKLLKTLVKFKSFLVGKFDAKA